MSFLKRLFGRKQKGGKIGFKDLKITPHGNLVPEIIVDELVASINEKKALQNIFSRMAERGEIILSKGEEIEFNPSRRGD